MKSGRLLRGRLALELLQPRRASSEFSGTHRLLADLWAGRHRVFSQEPAVMTGRCSFIADLVMFT